MTKRGRGQRRNRRLKNRSRRPWWHRGFMVVFTQRGTGVA